MVSCGYGFVENIDFMSFTENSVKPRGDRPAQDHQITIEMAKELCMLQRNERGKQARQYFIQLEKDWNSPEKVMARALQIADKKIKQLETVNAVQQQQIGEELNLESLGKGERIALGNNGTYVFDVTDEKMHLLIFAN